MNIELYTIYRLKDQSNDIYTTINIRSIFVFPSLKYHTYQNLLDSVNPIKQI